MLYKMTDESRRVKLYSLNPHPTAEDDAWIDKGTGDITTTILDDDYENHSRSLFLQIVSEKNG